MGWGQAAMAGASMLGDSSSSESSQSQTGEWSQDVWEGQSPFLKQMYGQAGDLFNWGNQGMQGLTPGAVGGMQDIFNQSNPYWQNQMQGGAYQGMDLQNQYNQALQGGGNEQFMNEQIMGGQGNDYVDAMKQSMQSDAFENLGQQYAGIDQRAASGGLGGSSRHGLVQARAYEDTADALQKAQTGLGYESFADDQARKMGIAQRADQFDMSKLQNVSGMLGQQQNAMQGGLNFGQNMQGLNMGQYMPYQMPGQSMSNYANAIGRPTMVGSGSSGEMGESSSGSGMFGK